MSKWPFPQRVELPHSNQFAFETLEGSSREPPSDAEWSEDSGTQISHAVTVFFFAFESFAVKSKPNRVQCVGGWHLAVALLELCVVF